VVVADVFEQKNRWTFIDFPRETRVALPWRPLHCILDNASYHYPAEVQDWLRRHPRNAVPRRDPAALGRRLSGLGGPVLQGCESPQGGITRRSELSISWLVSAARSSRASARTASARRARVVGCLGTKSEQQSS
jgi:hypothetical protein